MTSCITFFLQLFSRSCLWNHYKTKSFSVADPTGARQDRPASLDGSRHVCHAPNLRQGPLDTTPLTPHRSGYQLIFFCLLLVENSHQGWCCSLSLLPATPLSRCGTLEGLFELTFGTLQGPSTCLRLPERKRYKDNVMCVALGGEVPGHVENNWHKL